MATAYTAGREMTPAEVALEEEKKLQQMLEIHGADFVIRHLRDLIKMQDQKISDLLNPKGNDAPDKNLTHKPEAAQSPATPAGSGPSKQPETAQLLVPANAGPDSEDEKKQK